MKILAIGDLVGEIGLLKLKKNLENLQIAEKIDYTIVNSENVSDGMGINTKDFNELNKLNIDTYTMGNHTWGKKDIFNFIDTPKLIRPANYSKGVPGHGYYITTKNDKKIAVIDLIGRTDMGVQSDNPFTTADEILKNIEADIIVVDFHAEATAEKVAMGNYLDGRVTAMFGTHTHVQTADETILPNGTAYITDIGMTGPKNSVIGMEIEASLKRFVTSIPERYRTARGDCMINGIVIEINDSTCKAEKIYRINI